MLWNRLQVTFCILNIINAMKYKHFYISGKSINVCPFDYTHQCSSTSLKKKGFHSLPNSNFSSKNGVPLLWSSFTSKDKPRLQVCDRCQSYPNNIQNKKKLLITSKQSLLPDDFSQSISKNVKDFKTINSDKIQSINLMEVFWPNQQSQSMQTTFITPHAHRKLPYKKWREQERGLANESLSRPTSPLFNDSKTLLQLQSVKKMLVDGSKTQKYHITKLHYKLEILGRKLTDQDELIKKGAAITNQITKITCSNINDKPISKYAWGSSKPSNAK